MPSNGRKSLQRGEVVQLDTEALGIPRRDFFRAVAGAGGGLLGLKEMIGDAYGKKPEGVPLVLTRDRKGRPDRVRFISKERHRRIQVFKKYPFHSHEDQKGRVQRVELEQKSEDPNDLGFKIYLDLHTGKILDNFPDNIKSIPLKFEEKRFGGGSDY